MNVFRSIGLAVAIAGSFVFTPAQTPTVSTILVTGSGATQKYEMTVTLGYSTVQTLVAIPAPPPINVNPGTTLKLNLGYNDSDLVSVSWTKNSQPFGVTAPEIALTNVTESDSGYYQATIHRTGGDIVSDTATIRVGFAARQTLLNLSTRATIGPANPTVICGFVVAPSPGALNESKTLLIRAIGPSLTQFGVTHPLAHPVLKIFRSDGTLIDLPTLSILPIATIAMKIGAFPLPTGSSDISLLIALPAGIYTAQIFSAAVDGSGEVMLEVYEVPDRALDYENNFPS